MLFHSSIRQELSRSFSAVLIVLLTVVMTMTLIRTLGMASRGGIAPADILVAMGLTVFSYAPTLLTMGLFIAIIVSLSRMHRDNEMIVWQCSGRGVLSLLPVLLRFAWPVLLVIAGLALWVVPWANQRIDYLKAQFEHRSDVERVEPGQFRESARGERVFFVDKDTANAKAASHVFVSTHLPDREIVTSARSGRVEHRPDGTYVLLEQGQNLEIDPRSATVRVTAFEQYGTRITARGETGDDRPPPKTVHTATLLADPTPAHLAELFWRLSLVLAAGNFLLIAVVVSHVQPRAGRGANLILALCTFVVYQNLLHLGHNWVTHSVFVWWHCLLGLHGVVLVLVVARILALQHPWGLRDLR
ncbi:LPS export ABC transporter permease LptF [Candidatus Symbiobacter mobilis]|uniref:Lipopolysaccharide export system permease protein LptF n=1 Tax=Candidatus Symbiobacter mobilis CR TaxID=946483 RepID=U5N9U9_9BURK|nr:LPS export ABC transporter permease LptF [Candidatus Symbiobacter mobilis]AGX88095.1 lipopolysaccharide export system permease protein [Candidatus Symbiobacter mobilis CR]